MKSRDRDDRDERSRGGRDDARNRSKEVRVRDTSSRKSGGEVRGTDSGRAHEPGAFITRGRDLGWPFDSRLTDEMSRFFGRLGLSGEFLGGDRWLPQVDVLRRGDELVVRADLPGLSKDDISVDVSDNMLTIRGERQEETTDEGEGYYLHERRAGSFYRSIPLPDGADVEHARARFTDGVLEVSVPAPKEGERGRHIEIR